MALPCLSLSLSVRSMLLSAFMLCVPVSGPFGTILCVYLGPIIHQLGHTDLDCNDNFVQGRKEAYLVPVNMTDLEIRNDCF